MLSKNFDVMEEFRHSRAADVAYSCKVLLLKAASRLIKQNLI